MLLQGFYLKLGQILACKTDMLPGPYTESLSRLLDRLPPVPYSAVRRTIRAELGVSPEVLFRDVDPFPLASATIAQVRHRLVVRRRSACHYDAIIGCLVWPTVTTRKSVVPGPLCHIWSTSQPHSCCSYLAALPASLA